MRGSRFLLTLVFICIAVQLAAQSCQIVSDSRTCLGDFIGFKVQASGGIQSYDWDFSGEGVSQVAEPIFKFTSTGIKQIKVKVLLAGGATCTATRTITVNDLPTANFVIDSTQSQFCFSKNRICFKDISARATSSAAPMQKRLFVFGDGGAEQTLAPAFGSVVCHTYDSVTTYPVTLEVTDTNGCKSLVRTNITLKPDFKTEFVVTETGGCDSLKVCLQNTTVLDPALVKKFRWEWGDGVIDTTHYDLTCRVFKGAMLTYPRLVVTGTNGCRDSVAVSIPVSFSPINFKLTKDKVKSCFQDNMFTFTATLVPGATYSWTFYDSSGNQVAAFNSSQQIQYSFDETGRYTVRVLALKFPCKYGYTDTVEVWGPRPRISAYNAYQCTLDDTVYFCNATSGYKSNPVNYVHWWDFSDPTAPGCTTDTKKGQGLNNNCNFSVDANGKHFYHDTLCTTVTYKVRDTVNGCEAETKVRIIVGPPAIDSLKVFNMNKCYGPSHAFEQGFEYTVMAKLLSCGFKEAYINLDSAADRDNFIPYPLVPKTYFYDSIADSNGWVTVGVTLANGDSVVHYSCDSSSRTGATCVDTVWFHNIYRLLPEPVPGFFLQLNSSCTPTTIYARLFDSTQRFMTRMIWSWGDDDIDTVQIAPGTTILPGRSHIYRDQGIYQVLLRMENENGCFMTQSASISIGYFKTIKGDSVVCPNLPVNFRDSVEYFYANTGFWYQQYRADEGKESMAWDFGDGQGFATAGPYPQHQFTPGVYTVRLATIDSTGCRDTISKKIYATGVTAAIRQGAKPLGCDGIIQFFDSSYNVITYPGDSITEYYWDFGDNTLPSTLKDPYHEYTRFGKFTVTHIVKNIKGCVDTVQITLDLIGPRPEFIILTDTIGCVPHKVTFRNASERVKNYIWYFGDNGKNTLSTLSDTNVFFTYTEPGVYDIFLYGADSVYNPATGSYYYCSKLFPDTPFQARKRVYILPIPPADFSLPDTICPGTNPLVDLSDPVYTDYRWFFSNGDSVITTFSPASYDFTPGDYTVTYTPTYIPGPMQRQCYDTAVRKVFVTDVKAQFDTFPGHLPPEFWFNNQSQHAVKYSWNFGHPQSKENTSVLFNPMHNYDPDTGLFQVCLIAENRFGCRDTACMYVRNTFFPYVHYFNVFTPDNADGFNDDFDVDIYGEEHYDIKIYNRWGELVFHGDMDGENGDGRNWNGRKFNTGEQCPSGTYYYVLNYQLKYRRPQTVTGTCTLLRPQ